VDNSHGHILFATSTPIVADVAPWPPVLALTTFDDGELLSGALRAGAPGSVLKERGAPTPRAATLSISNVTVKSHIGRIFVKLDLRDRAAVIVYAYENGIVAPR